MFAHTLTEAAAILIHWHPLGTRQSRFFADDQDRDPQVPMSLLIYNMAEIDIRCELT